MPHVIRNQNPNYRDPECTLVMDSKGVFDALDNVLLQDDRKSALRVTAHQNHTGLHRVSSTASETGEQNSAIHTIHCTRTARINYRIISEVNAAVRQCHAVPITITIWSLPFHEFRWTTFTDSSFDTGERQRHQQGWCAPQTSMSIRSVRHQ